jgi:hypothetical protein
VCAGAFFFLLQCVFDAGAFVFAAGAFSAFWLLSAARGGSFLWHVAAMRGMSFVATEAATMTEPLQL